MKISASINSAFNLHEATVQTNDAEKKVGIAPKTTGYGSSINGGELLMLALATCYCNDIYREAAKRNIAVSGVEVNCSGEFGAEGEPAKNIEYTVKIYSDASKDDIYGLIVATDHIAEIHNTLRKGTNVVLKSKA